jgi:RimJ/RimL family protein N-acetyltransferase
MLEIREYRESDWPKAWPILQEIVRAGDTYTFSPQSTEEEIRKAWVEVPAKTFIACDSEGRVLGTYFIKANQPGLGAHVCNCGYVVPRTMQGRGIASLMCEHSQAQALAMGFKAMQFNFRCFHEHTCYSTLGAIGIFSRRPAPWGIQPSEVGLRRRTRHV